MSSYVSLEEQIKESQREHRMIGDFTNLPPLPTESTLAQKEDELLNPILLGWKYEIVSDPFSLTLNEFLSLTLEKAQEMHSEAYKQCKRLLEEAWKKGIKQVIICNKEIIYESKETYDIANEIVEQLAKQHNKACYAFSSPDMVEMVQK